MSRNYNRTNRFMRILASVLTAMLICSFCACSQAELIEASYTTAAPANMQSQTTRLPAQSTSPDASHGSITPAPGTTTTEPVTTEPPVVDVTPPVVTGQDFTITEGDSVSFKSKITVSDDYDEEPTIDIDRSAVDLDTPGTYTVVYTVTDDAGNSTVFTLRMIVKKKVVDVSDNEEYVLSQAQTVLESITDSSMSKLEIAFAIYNWTGKNVRYIGTSDKSNWINGAYEGFKKRQGDCYTYFATAKALLTVAGIDHIDIYRPPNQQRSTRHYWLLVNVGDGWYHFDCNNSTFFAERNANFFMVTDEEIWAWDAKYYRGEHAYDSTGLPKVSTVSIQDKIDYDAKKVID